MKHSKFTAALWLLLLLVVSGSLVRASAQPLQRRRPTVTHPNPQPAQQPRRETEQNFDALIASGSYAIYAELRGVGQLLRSSEFTQAMNSLQLLTGPNSKDTKELEDFIFFFTTQAETLNDTKVMLSIMPTRTNLPEGLVAFQFPTIEVATTFEPKLRAFLGRQLQSMQPPPVKPAEPRPRAAPNTTGKQTANSRKQSNPPPAPALFNLKRVGNVLLIAETAFTLKNLRGNGVQLQTDDGRFQTMRSRLASEPLFLYCEVANLEKGYAQEREDRQKKEEAAAKQIADNPNTPANVIAQTTPTPALSATPPIEMETQPMNPAPTPSENETPQPEPTGDATVSTDDPVAPEEDAQPKDATVQDGGAQPPNPASVVMPMLLDRMLGGMPRWPEVVGVALDYNKDDYVVRALLESHEHGQVNLIPFAPGFISGPVSTLEASSITPATTEIFASVSVDWQQMYDSLLKGEQLPQPPPPTEGAPEPENQPPSIETSIELFEKAAGFKIKDDLLPALGNEISVSAPLTWFDSSLGAQTKNAEPQESQAGPVVLVSLNNAEAMRKMLPHILEVTGMKSPLSPGTTEKRGGFEINSYGGVSCAFINNYLALAIEAPTIRHFIDGEQQTLVSNQNFRSSTGWQPRQKLGQVYVSPALMENLLAEARKWLDPTDTELQNLFTRLDIQTLPATYSVTSEGSGEVLHELHLPKNIFGILTAQSIVNTKQAPLIQNESMGMFRLREIYNMEESFKAASGKGRYGTLEEMTAATSNTAGKPPSSQTEKSEAEQLPYKIEVASTGEKFQATATPKEYNKLSRRSFFIDESGVLRGADHKGAPATASDPPVD